MKKLILVFAAIGITAGLSAQIDSTNKRMSHRDMNHNQNQNMNYSSIDRSHPDGVMMQNGKMMKVENGQMTILDNEMTLNNGTKISSDGNYTDKDGKEMMLEEGQHLDMSGNMTAINKDGNRDLYQNNSDDKSDCDGVTMKDGKMMKVKDGQYTTLEDDMTMGNGTKIKSDGNYTDKDGKELRMQEGEYMDMSGNMTARKSNNDKNMYLIDDKHKK